MLGTLSGWTHVVTGTEQGVRCGRQCECRTKQLKRNNRAYAVRELVNSNKFSYFRCIICPNSSVRTTKLSFDFHGFSHEWAISGNFPIFPPPGKTTHWNMHSLQIHTIAQEILLHVGKSPSTISTQKATQLSMLCHSPCTDTSKVDCDCMWRAHVLLLSSTQYSVECVRHVVTCLNNYRVMLWYAHNGNGTFWIFFPAVRGNCSNAPWRWRHRQAFSSNIYRLNSVGWQYIQLLTHTYSCRTISHVYIVVLSTWTIFNSLTAHLSCRFHCDKYHRFVSGNALSD